MAWFRARTVQRRVAIRAQGQPGREGIRQFGLLAGHPRRLILASPGDAGLTRPCRLAAVQVLISQGRSPPLSSV
jgi:hypothetical protein